MFTISVILHITIEHNTVTVACVSFEGDVCFGVPFEHGRITLILYLSLTWWMLLVEAKKSIYDWMLMF
jgi:hypothetical protein